MLFRAVKPYQLVVDISIAAVCFLLRGSLPIGSSPLMVIVVVGMAIALGMRRVSPTLSLAIAWATVVVQMALLLPPDISNLAILPMLFATGAYGTNLVKWLGLVSAGVGALVASLYAVFSGYITGGDLNHILSTLASDLPRIVALFFAGLVASLALFGLSWTLGFLYRTWLESRSRQTLALRARSEREAAEREVAVEQERTRIARDMHDVVAHSLAVVIAQADGARYAAKSDPEATDAALSTISVTAREALSDVRVLLGQLRHNQSEGPQPVLADLDRLFEQLRSSGLAIMRHDSGEPHPLGTSQQLAVYRIVQESLTNALRHGPDPKEALVRFDWHADELELSISNSYTPSDGKRGHGVDGMRERAILVGGSLSAEPREGAWIVSATIPVGA